MILREAKARIVKRSNKLPSGRAVKRVYAVEIYNEDGYCERETPYMATPENAITYLRSTGNSYRHINITLENGSENIYINENYYIINNGKTYTLYKIDKNLGDEKIKSFREWHRFMEFMVSGNI
jgi:hypothetical protein